MEPRHLFRSLRGVGHAIICVHVVHWCLFVLIGPNEQRRAKSRSTQVTHRTDTNVLRHDADGPSVCLHRGSQPGERGGIGPSHAFTSIRPRRILGHRLLERQHAIAILADDGVHLADSLIRQNDCQIELSCVLVINSHICF